MVMRDQPSVDSSSIIDQGEQFSIIHAYSVSVTDSAGLDDDIAIVNAHDFLGLLGAQQADDADRDRIPGQDDSEIPNRARLNVSIGNRLFSGYIVDSVKYQSKPNITTIKGKRTADKELAVEAVKGEIEKGLENVIRGGPTANIMRQANDALLPEENLGTFITEIAETAINKTDYASYIDVLNDLGIILAQEKPSDSESPYILVPLNSTQDEIGEEIVGAETAIQNTFTVDIPRYLFRPAAVNNIRVKCSYRENDEPGTEQEVAAVNKTGEEHYVSTVTTGAKRAATLIVIEYEKLLAQSAKITLTVPGNINVFVRNLLTFRPEHWIARNVWRFWRVSTVKHNWRSGAYTTEVVATPTHDPQGTPLENAQTIIRQVTE